MFVESPPETNTKILGDDAPHFVHFYRLFMITRVGALALSLETERMLGLPSAPAYVASCVRDTSRCGISFHKTNASARREGRCRACCRERAAALLRESGRGPFRRHMEEVRRGGRRVTDGLERMAPLGRSAVNRSFHRKVCAVLGVRQGPG